MSAAEWAWFLDQPLAMEKTFQTADHWTNYKLQADRDLGDVEDGYARRRWHECEEPVLAEWIEEFPGMRPSTWWRFSAPERRRRGETEVAYLDRLGLWLPGERERVDGIKFAGESLKKPRRR